MLRYSAGGQGGGSYGTLNHPSSPSGLQIRLQSRGPTDPFAISLLDPLLPCLSQIHTIHCIPRHVSPPIEIRPHTCDDPFVMKSPIQSLLLIFLFVFASQLTLAADPPRTLEENFTTPLSPDWFWGLGTWTAKDGILRGYESGPRRHGPVKMRKFVIRDGTVECDFRLEGKATFAGIIFNGSQERGHIVHLVMATDKLRILAHPRKGENVELLSQPSSLPPAQWHHVTMQFKGPQLTATIDGKTISANHPCIAEEKLTFGLGGESGGPEGEKAGALEFRKLKITTP